MDDMQNLSKAQRKELQKQRSRGEKAKRIADREREKKMKKYKKWGILLIIVLAISGYIYNKTTYGPQTAVSAMEYNFGDVSVRDGMVSTNFTIRNDGVGDLVFNDMETSCMCTTAALINNGVLGPSFGMKMHGTNPKNWRAVIPPGGEAILKVDYNPTVHKDMRGPFTRTITISTNDIRDRRVEVRIGGNQVR